MPLCSCIGGCISVDVFCGVCTIYNTVYIYIVLVKYIYVIIDKCNNGRKKKKDQLYTYTESNNNNPGFKHTKAMTMHILLNVPAVSTMR